jgi:hypothetical protein
LEDIQNQIEGIRLRRFGHVRRKEERNTRKITGNEHNRKKTQGQTTSTMARPSQESHRKQRKILREDKGNA